MGVGTGHEPVEVDGLIERSPACTGRFIVAQRSATKPDGSGTPRSSRRTGRGITCGRIEVAPMDDPDTSTQFQVSTCHPVCRTLGAYRIPRRPAFSSHLTNILQVLGCYPIRYTLS